MIVGAGRYWQGRAKSCPRPEILSFCPLKWRKIGVEPPLLEFEKWLEALPLSRLYPSPGHIPTYALGLWRTLGAFLCIHSNHIKNDRATNSRVHVRGMCRLGTTPEYSESELNITHKFVTATEYSHIMFIWGYFLKFVLILSRGQLYVFVYCHCV